MRKDIMASQPPPDKPGPNAAPAAPDAGQQRLSEALRRNLRRRKAPIAKPRNGLKDA